jgi:adenylate kinase family enzyme
MTARRIAVLGSPGSVKSTFARQLGERTGLPVVHLDRLYWNPGWVESSWQVFRERHAAVIREDSWVIDGNYSSGDRQARLERADLVVVLEASRLACLWRVGRRSVVLHGKTRPDMPDDCPERFSLSFLAWIWNWHRRHPRLVDEIRKAFPEKAVIPLRSRSEIDAFLWQVTSDASFVGGYS